MPLTVMVPLPLPPKATVVPAVALERTAWRSNCWLLLLLIVKAPPVALRVKTPNAVPMDWVPVT